MIRKNNRRLHLASRLMGAFTLGLFALTGFQPAAAQPRPVKPIATPDQSADVPLPGASGASVTTEQWFISAIGTRRVRNVTLPTITPFLPAASAATGAAVIIAPGGGKIFLSIDSEGYEVARWLADHGIAAFVLKYRLVPSVETSIVGTPAPAAIAGASPIDSGPAEVAPGVIPQALEDALAAVKLVRSRSTEWRVDPKKVGFLGFSAGANLALAVGLVAQSSSRPDFIAPIYPRMAARTVPNDAPPMFAAVALDDPIMAIGKPLSLIDSWRAAGRSLEVHLYNSGGHGFGMRSSAAATALWIDEFYAWMKDQIGVKAVH